MSAGKTSSWRILVGASSFADAQSALALIERLAGPRLGGLGGLFLEEESLSDISGLPMQRLVTSGGSLTPVPSRKELGALFERDAMAFRNMISGIAQSRKWEFATRRGELISSLFDVAQAQGWDLLFVGYSVARRPRRQVVLIAPPPEASPRAAELAGELAQALGTELRSLDLYADGTAAEPGLSEAEPISDIDALFARLSRLPAAALVIDISAGPLRSASDLRRLRLAARCPMIILGAGRGDVAVD